MAKKADNTESLGRDIQEVKEIITDLVAPHYRQNINVIPDHITMLHGTKLKKQYSRKKEKKKSSTLTKKEYIKLGLYNIPTKSMKYNDVQDLHKLWKQYIKEHLHLNENANIPNVTDSNYDNFSKLLVKMDLHGAKINVIKSRCPSHVGLKGIIILDTKNTFKIISEDNKVRTLPKSDCIFSVEFNNLEFHIFGKHLTIRPAERSVKKIKNFINLDL